MANDSWTVVIGAIPNLSTGGRPPTPGAIDIHADPDHGRSVVSFYGPAGEVAARCLELARWAVGSLSIEAHEGTHPRFGVLDVLPFVTYGSSEGDVQAVAESLRSRIEDVLDVPVHTYGRAHPQGRSLPALRRFLRAAQHRAHPSAGVVCLGIRDPLIAFNVDFEGEVAAATRVARLVRSPEIRALGFPLASRGLVQVSMNLIAPDRLGPREAFERVVALAGEDLRLVDCEVVGLVPEANLAELEGLPLIRPARSIEQAIADGPVFGRPEPAPQ